MKTKTKSIFISFMVLLLSFCASPFACACPKENSEEVSTTVSTIVKAVSRLSSMDDDDVCLDCGHSKSCCYSHQEQPAIMLATSTSVSGCHYASQLWSPTMYFSALYLLQESIGCVGSRAPPWIIRATLQNLHQKLLV